MNHETRTIAAIATPTGQGGVGIIRISGSFAYTIGCQLTKKTLSPRMAHFSKIYDENDAVIDEAVVIYFKAPHSFTGEDVVEIQGHGGSVLLNWILSRCFKLGAYQAAAGEFSYRAFENDKLDLVQAESISDLINATSIAQAKSAMRSLSGEFSNKIHILNDKITNLRLYVEASIDFSDEEDVTFLSDGVIESRLNEIIHSIKQIINTAKQGVILKNGVQVVIAGKPNAGKSSLLNKLSGTNRAIVTDIAGTTRDTLQETVVINGLTLHLTDTAGIRDADNVVEKIGIERAKQAIEQADILLLVYDLSQDENPIELAKNLFGENIFEDESMMKNLLIVGNKMDLINQDNQKNYHQMINDEKIDLVYVSCETGEGLTQLADVLCHKVGFYPNEDTMLARTRHVDALQRALEHANEAHEQLTVYEAGELVAESLRLSQQALGEITGQMSSDDLLGKIFSSFCIGK